MGNKRTIGTILLVVGIAILLLSLLAEPLGIGVSPGFGYYQKAGTIVGAIGIIGGLVLMLRK